MGDSFKRTLRAAVSATVPVFFGYLFVGMAFGLLMQKSGYHYLWALLTSLIVYAGSMQFVLVGLLSSWTGLIQVAIVTLTVNIRHVFYGLSLIQSFQEFQKSRPYMIFSLTDETYSLLCSAAPPEGVTRKGFFFWISLLNQGYWIAGSLLGATVGSLVPFDSTGIDFAMTALFVVIFVEQWMTAKSHFPAVVGLCAGLLCLLLFGPNNFLLPALLIAVGILMGCRKRIEQKIGALEELEQTAEEVPQ